MTGAARAALGGPRVVHVSMPTTEGVAVVLLGYVRDQVARGWQVSVACPRDGWLADRARAAGAQVVEWRATRDPGRRTPGEVRRLHGLLRRLRPDVVHLHSAKAGLAGRLALRGRVTTVYQPHGWSFHAADGLVGRSARAWERLGSRWTHRLVAVSEAELLIGRRAGVAGDAVVVPNGVDLDRFPDGGDAAAARAALGLPEAPTVVCLGRLSRQKGQDRLLELWPEVRREVPDARLLLVGDGPDRDRLAGPAATAGGVRLVGQRDDPAAWLAAGDVVAVASRWEGMALAPLEAMACGRPVVGYDVTGLRESVPDGAGELVADGDRAALAVALAARLADPARARREGREARQHVVACHDARRSAEQVARVYGVPDRSA